MKKLIPLLILIVSLISVQNTQAQNRMISGVVTSKSDGSPLPGVNILIKGTTRGSETDFDGNFSIEASRGDLLIFSYMGMKSASITIGDANKINIVLLDDAESLSEVIVTALGMKKEKKALTYSAQEIKGDALTRVKQTNPINSLSGKTAGLTITKSSSGLGGASKVVLRGNASTVNNDPLYVIDGIPMLNSGNGSNGEEAGTSIFGGHTGNRDGGDALSLINPDDIESISVLKGASAAALYGSQGANGVILITTKSGKDGKLSVNISSGLTFDNVLSLPKLQSQYQSTSVGQKTGINGTIDDARSWGAKTPGLRNDYAKDFFNTGYTSTQSFSLNAGTKKAQTYLSYANTYAEGVMPENRMIRNNINIKESTLFLNDKIKVSAGVNLSDQRIWNKPGNGLYSNTLTGVYLNPVGINLDTYKNFEYFNPETNMMDQYRTSFNENIQQNPYWLIHRNPTKDIAQRVFVNVSIKYQLTEDLSLQSRASIDKSFFTFDKRMYAGSDQNLVPSTGRYLFEKTENTQQYLDFIANYNTQASEDLSIGIIFGTSLTKYKIGDQIHFDSGLGGLKYPNQFNIQNFLSTNDIQQSVGNRELQSVFGSINLGYKNKYFLDITGRNDWSSTLVNTNSLSFFYPSIGVTALLSEVFEMPDFVSFAKIRGSYAIVGNDIPTYATIPLNRIPLVNNGVVAAPFAPLNGETLEPQKQNSYEIGTEWRLFESRLGIDFTYYNTKTTNQIFYIQAEPNPYGYIKNIVNAGEISNTGIELTVNGKPIVGDIFNWNTIFNFASNKNKVVSVHPSLTESGAILTEAGVNGYRFSLVEGENFGSIQAQSLVRNADGLPILNNDGTLQRTDFETVGFAQPDWTLGWNNNFEYKNLSLNFLIDAKIGGEVLSVTEAINDYYGVSQATADARSRNGGMINVASSNGTNQITAYNYYSQVAGRAGLLGEYVYDATNIRLAEVAIGYTIKNPSPFVENLRFSLIANNLFFIYKDAPFDPNIASSTGIGLQGVDIYGQPSTRSIGFNINVNF